METDQMKRLLTIYKALQDITIAYLYLTEEEFRPYLEELHSAIYVQQKLEQYRGISTGDLLQMLRQLEKERKQHWDALRA